MGGALLVIKKAICLSLLNVVTMQMVLMFSSGDKQLKHVGA